MKGRTGGALKCKCFTLPNAVSPALGAEPGFRPLNVREFPDTKITSSPTVREELVSYYYPNLWQLKWNAVISVRQQRSNEATVENKDMDFSIEAHPLDDSPFVKADPDLRWKRMLDVLLILLALPFLIPLALFIALLIRSVSTGPVLFRQERVGHQGRRFMCFKFRTMFVDADTATHQGHLHQLMNSDKPMMKMDSEGIPASSRLACCSVRPVWMSCPN